MLLATHSFEPKRLLLERWRSLRNRSCLSSQFFVGMGIKKMFKIGERYIPTIAAAAISIVAILSGASEGIQQGSLIVVGAVVFFTVVVD